MRVSWYEAYRKKVLKCESCSARKECIRPVPGEGNPEANVVFVGRNPGRTEDQTGHPFVGAAGKIFEHFLVLAGLERASVFVTNLYLCFTKGNRLPSRAEVKACVPQFLMWSLKEIKPKLVVTFGSSANYYINGFSAVTRVHGKLFHHQKGFYVLPSIHPAAVCYNKEEFERLKDVASVVQRVLCA